MKIISTLFITSMIFSSTLSLGLLFKDGNSGRKSESSDSSDSSESEDNSQFMGQLQNTKDELHRIQM